jgi:hypothetical protein
MPYNPHNSTQSETVAGIGNNTINRNVGMQQIKLSYAPRYGVITKVQIKKGSIPTPFVQLRWQDDNKLSKIFIPLEDHPNTISMIYAARLEDLVGYTVKVTRRSATDASMTGKLVADTRFDRDKYDLELPSSGVKL